MLIPGRTRRKKWEEGVGKGGEGKSLARLRLFLPCRQGELKEGRKKRGKGEAQLTASGAISSVGVLGMYEAEVGKKQHQKKKERGKRGKGGGGERTLWTTPADVDSALAD